jgi:CspA family cold shock protein
MKGTIKWFNDRKGFGFIEGEDEKDIFVHRNALEEGIQLNDGDEVEYEVEASEKGPNAINVKKIENN